MPEFARDAHGNLAAQNRRFGAQVGADTARRRADADDAARVAHAPNAESSPAGTAPMQLLTANNCLACHGLDRALVGPALKDVAGKYASRSDAASHLAGRIRFGSSGVWGAIAMPAQPLSDADALVIAQWLAAGAGR
ncbi:MAG: c-type cytochrome [Chitinophagaceae bacterium]|nr:c-type cytochrome [Rubrivivax sp.]